MHKMYDNQTGFWVMIAKKAPRVAYAILVWICSNVYGRIAVILNDWGIYKVYIYFNNRIVVLCRA